MYSSRRRRYMHRQAQSEPSAVSTWCTREDPAWTGSQCQTSIRRHCRASSHSSHAKRTANKGRIQRQTFSSKLRRISPDEGAAQLLVAIDIGGTFTDLMALDEATGRFAQAKTLTTPSQLVQGVVDCLRKSGVDVGCIEELIHGSTTAINTLIERKGAKTALIVTRGTRDVYSIGRGNRPESYNLFFHRHRPLVPRHLTREVAERCLSSGEVLHPIDRESVEEACRLLSGEGVEAIAVCFLHSYVNPEHERIAGRIVREVMPRAYVSLSREILREYREFERMSTTVVNAYIGPKVGGYVRSLKS